MVARESLHIFLASYLKALVNRNWLHVLSLFPQLFKQDRCQVSLPETWMNSLKFIQTNEDSYIEFILQTKLFARNKQLSYKASEFAYNDKIIRLAIKFRNM